MARSKRNATLATGGLGNEAPSPSVPPVLPQEPQWFCHAPRNDSPIAGHVEAVVFSATHLRKLGFDPRKLHESGYIVPCR